MPTQESKTVPTKKDVEKANAIADSYEFNWLQPKGFLPSRNDKNDLVNMILSALTDERERTWRKALEAEHDARCHSRNCSVTCCRYQVHEELISAALADGVDLNAKSE